MRLFPLVTLVIGIYAHAETADYKRSTSACGTCSQIEDLLVKHDQELVPEKRLELALKLAGTIKKISVKSKSSAEQKREIYFAINGAIQVLDDDFDSETVVRLLDLRVQSPKSFDYVFWRFPLVHQQRIVERMKAFKDDKIRPNAKIPEVKVIES